MPIWPSLVMVVFLVYTSVQQLNKLEARKSDGLDAISFFVVALMHHGVLYEGGFYDELVLRLFGGK